MEMCPWPNLLTRDVPKTPWGTSPGLSERGPEGVTPTGLEVAAGPAVHYSVAQSAGSFEQGVQPLRPSLAALGWDPDGMLAAASHGPGWAWTAEVRTGPNFWAAGYLGLFRPNDTAKAWSVSGIPSWKSVKACLSIRSTMRSFDKYPTGRAKSVGPSQISRPGAPGRGDVRQHVTSSFWMRCGCAPACQHGLPCVEVMMSGGVGGGFLGDAPARCSESDGRMIYGVSEAITDVVLRPLENQGSYDILMNGFSLQSTTTPKKANKGGVLEGQSRLKKDLRDGLKISAWWSLIGASG
ncbi:unnamed protein product [Prunus armeniaca]